MSRRWLLVLVVALVALACKAPVGGGPSPRPKPTPVKGFPSSMVALGDSLTAAFGSCLAPTACPRNSWSTGDGTLVNSHFRRIQRANPAISGHNRNLAIPGATVADLPAEASQAASRPVDYVTVLIGGNDACHTVMTSTSAFRSSVDRALGILKKAMPNARVLVVGIPDLYRVWVVGHTSRVAVQVWKSGVCPNLLTNPTSTARADVDRRAAVRDRVSAYNGQLRDACASYGHRCRFDSVSGVAFTLTMLSAIDFFHPNATGQNVLADQTYPSSFTW